MEDALAVCAAPPDPARPLVCFDEAGKELRADARPPLPAAPGRPAREDAECERRGGANLFVWVAPHEGRRGGTAHERRTAHDWALAMRDLVDRAFPGAARVRVVLDNPNTHDPASLYKAFPPAEAARIWSRLELHSTPKHGSWLNVAELEIAALARQCLARRIASAEAPAAEAEAWAAERNAANVRIAWRVGVADARTKLKRLYPVPQQDE